LHNRKGVTVIKRGGTIDLFIELIAYSMWGATQVADVI